MLNWLREWWMASQAWRHHGDLTSAEMRRVRAMRVAHKVALRNVELLHRLDRN